MKGPQCRDIGWHDKPCFGLWGQNASHRIGRRCWWGRATLHPRAHLAAGTQHFPQGCISPGSQEPLRENIPTPCLCFSTNVARLQSRRQKIKESHYFGTQGKLIKSKFSQNVKSWTELRTHARFSVDSKGFPSREPHDGRTARLQFSPHVGRSQAWPAGWAEPCGFSGAGKNKSRVASQ